MREVGVTDMWGSARQDADAGVVHLIPTGAPEGGCWRHWQGVWAPAAPARHLPSVLKQASILPQEWALSWFPHSISQLTKMAPAHSPALLGLGREVANLLCQTELRYYNR